MSDDLSRVQIRVEAMKDRILAELRDKFADVARIAFSGPREGDEKLVKGMAIIVAAQLFDRKQEASDGE